MKVSERIELMYLQKYAQKPRVRVERPAEIAEICTSCKGQCKAAVGLKVCGWQTKEKDKHLNNKKSGGKRNE
ncbi:hypothetical protein JCM15765_00660 [Paradesulfitobacterium aromaticivorans]